jgi:glycine hydroxymethyltransferase
MGGDFDLTVGDAGFISFVRFNSAWFIGRKASLEHEKKRKSVVARFTFDEKGVRMARPGDPVCDHRGRMVGFVTSCAIDQNGMLTGQAYIDRKMAKAGTSIYIFQNAPEWQQKPPAELTNGDRVAIPSMATIVSRFL